MSLEQFLLVILAVVVGQLIVRLIDHLLGLWKTLKERAAELTAKENEVARNHWLHSTSQSTQDGPRTTNAPSLN